MKKTFSFSLLSLLIIFTSACKKDDPTPADDYLTITLNSTASESKLKPSMLGTDSKIRIKGTMTESDFKTLRKHTVLQYLDLSESTVVGTVVVSYNPEPGPYTEVISVEGNAIPYGAFGEYHTIIDKEVGTNDIIPAHKNLKSIVLPKNITHIGRYAFTSCLSLTEQVNFPQTLTHIMNYAFKSCENLKGELKFPDNIEVIGNSAFALCKSLTGELVIPKKISTIYQKAFMGCESITSLKMHDDVKIIGAVGFSGMKGLTSLTLPKNLEIIDHTAFHGCINLKGSLTLPESLEGINDRAFVSCGFDGTLTVNENLSELADYVFDDTKFKAIVLNWTANSEIPMWTPTSYWFPEEFNVEGGKPEYVIYIPTGTTELYEQIFPAVNGSGCFYNIKEGRPQ